MDSGRQPHRLRVPQEEAESQIAERIRKGQILQASAKRLYSEISDYSRAASSQQKERLESLYSDYERWRDFNRSLLQRLLDSDEIASEYEQRRELETTYGVFAAEVNELDHDLQDDIRRLPSIKERLPLFDSPEIKAHAEPLPPNTQSGDFVAWVGSIGLHNLAIVFTDIIDSTRLNNELGDAEWDRIRSAHFQRARELLRNHHGCLVKTIGDAVMAAFRNSIDALRFVIELESNTGHEVVCIRAGVHVGEVQVKEGDTFGAEVNFAARVSSKPEKGGIWVSDNVHEKWLRHDPRAELGWTRHEGMELKGFAGRFTLWSLPPSKGRPLSPRRPDLRGDTVQTSSSGQIAPSRLFCGRSQGPELLFGRDQELAGLDAAWSGASKKNIVTIVAWGGVGKTSLVAHWAAHRLAPRSAGVPACELVEPPGSAPSRGGTPPKLAAGDGYATVERYFDWSFYSQGIRREGDATGASHAASADLFLKEALEFFGDPDLAASNAGAWQKGERLAQLVGEHRSLLILDGLEPLQDARTGELRDDGLRALLRGLAAHNRGLCLVTTRQHLSDLATWHLTTAPEWELARLTDEAGAGLLTKLGVNGTDAEKRDLSTKVKGHALTLTLLGRYLKRAHHGDIRRVDRVDFQKADDHVQGGHAFRVIAAYERWFEEPSPAGAGDGGRRPGEGRGDNLGKTCLAILRMLGLFDRPATPDCLAALRDPPIPGLTDALATLTEDDWNEAVTHLVDEQPWEPHRTVGYSEDIAIKAMEAGEHNHTFSLGEPKPYEIRDSEFAILSTLTR